MAKIGINALALSHTQTMEQQTHNDQTSLTKDDAIKTPVLSPSDMEEFRAYKRQKRTAEVVTAIAKAESDLPAGEDIQRVCQRAIRTRQAAVKVPLSKLARTVACLKGSGVKTDCKIGGDGETLAKVKALEARLARKRGAEEITLTLAPSLVEGCRYGEIRRELKRVKRAVGKTPLKVRAESIFSPTALSRIARIACETGARFFSVPHFAGCEKLRIDLTGGCELEVTGVETLDEYKRLISAGVGRIATQRAWEIYSAWLRETNEPPAYTPPANEKPKIQPPPTPPAPIAKTRNEETNYRCRIVDGRLTFL